MPGKLIDGTTNNSAQPVKDAKAFCEGRAVKAAAGATSDNPHPATSESGKAWAAGYASTKAECCAA